MLDCVDKENGRHRWGDISAPGMRILKRTFQEPRLFNVTFEELKERLNVVSSLGVFQITSSWRP